jgi:hypothetical protein
VKKLLKILQLVILNHQKLKIPQVEEQQQVEEQPQATNGSRIIPPTPEVLVVLKQVQPQHIIEEGEIIEPMQVPPGEPDIPDQQ